MDITIDGKSLAEVEQIVSAIRRSANLQIANLYSELQNVVEKLTERDSATHSDPDAVNALAIRGKELADTMWQISKACAVEFYLPWDNEYSDTFSSDIESVFPYETSENVDEFVSVLQDMEYQSRKWNQSTC